MAYITAELDLDELDDWFKIGEAASQKKPQVVAQSKLGGRQFDAETGSYKVVDMKKELDSRLPKYRRCRKF